MFKTVATILIGCVLAVAPAFVAAANDVTDLEAKWHFIAIGQVFSDGDGIFLCVKTRKYGYGLWNATKDQFTPSKRGCYSTHSLHRLSLENPGPIQVSVGGLGSSPCAKMFSFFYGVDFPSGRGGSFYVVKRLEGPERDFRCGSNSATTAGTFTRTFGEILLNWTSLGDGTLLLYANNRARSYGLCMACVSTFTQPTLLELSAIPEKVWSSGSDTFLVPMSALGTAFADQNDNLLRYRAVMAVIGQTANSHADH